MNSLLVQFATEFAHSRTIVEVELNNSDLSKSTITLYEDKLADVLEYTEEAQAIFNTWYDHFYDRLSLFQITTLKRK